MATLPFSTANVSPAGKSASAKDHSIPRLSELLTSDPDAFVDKYTDIAAINLACAEGLPGAESFDGPRMLAALDAMALWVRQKTARS